MKNPMRMFFLFAGILILVLGTVVPAFADDQQQSDSIEIHIDGKVYQNADQTIADFQGTCVDTLGFGGKIVRNCTSQGAVETNRVTADQAEKPKKIVAYDGNSVKGKEIAEKIAKIMEGDDAPKSIMLVQQELSYALLVSAEDDLCNQFVANPLIRKRVIERWWMQFSYQLPNKTTMSRHDQMWINCGGTKVAEVHDGEIKWEL